MDLLDDDRLFEVRRRASTSTVSAAPADAQATPPASPTSNKSLLDWQTNERSSRDESRASAPTNGPVICPICKVRTGRQRCNSCQRVVCPADVWTMLGLCKGCATAEDVAHWHRPASPGTSNWLGGKS